MPTSPGALQTLLEKVGTLTPSERELVVQLERDSQPRKKREAVFLRGDTTSRLAIVQSGWVVARATLPSGDRTILQFYVRGDVIGLNDLGFGKAIFQSEMQTDGWLSFVDLRTLRHLAMEHPRLLAMMMSLHSLDEVALRDRLHAVARMPAEDRLIHFLLSLRSKISHAQGQELEHFPLHLSQRDIGDALGLTDIYINRLMRGFETSGQIEVSRPMVRITRPEDWANQVGYVNRYRSGGHNWIDD